jgi:F-type H+-transporting ATPase subunit b
MISANMLMLAFFSGGEEAVAQGGPLDVNPGLIIWTLVTFGILVLILAKVAWKPILKSLKEREGFIKDSLEKADNARKDAEKMISDNKVSILKAEEEAHKIVEQSRELAEKLKSQILEQSKTEAKKMIESASLEIQRKNAEAFNKLKEQVADIAVSAAEKIIKETLDKEKQINLVGKYIDELSKN